MRDFEYSVEEEMKLTDSQKKALQAVADGLVTYHEPMRITSRKKRIFGYRKDVIKRLEKDGLIILSRRDAGWRGVYILTELGNRALRGKA